MLSNMGFRQPYVPYIMSGSTFHIPQEWRNAAEEISAGGGPVIVIGAPGVGKTTFCVYLTARFCRMGKRVAWIDADPGQPHLGPPAVFSLGLFSEPVELQKRRRPLTMGFIGNTSPVGHLLDSIANLQKLYNHALTVEPDLIVINGCGLVNGGAARELAFHEIDMIAPRYVVAVQKTGEVEHLIAPHAHREKLLVLRLPASPDAHVVTSEARKAAREQRFKEYFRGADYQEIALSDVGLHGPGLGTGERLGFRDINLLSNALQGVVVHAELASDRLFVITDGDYAENELFAAKERYRVREITVVKRSELDYLLIGLNDDRNFCLGLGVLRELDVREFSLRVVTPLRNIPAISNISFGSLRVNPAGTELGRW
jgi:polynucleotide 5'-hydroxyl-kinase GRC3/NOL9